MDSMKASPGMLAKDCCWNTVDSRCRRRCTVSVLLALIAFLADDKDEKTKCTKNAPYLLIVFQPKRIAETFPLMKPKLRHSNQRVASRFNIVLAVMKWVFGMHFFAWEISAMNFRCAILWQHLHWAFRQMLGWDRTAHPRQNSYAKSLSKKAIVKVQQAVANPTPTCHSYYMCFGMLWGRFHEIGCILPVPHWKGLLPSKLIIQYSVEFVNQLQS